MPSEKGRHTSLQPCESRSLGSSLSLWWHRYSHIFFLWGLAGVKWLLSKSICPAKLPLSWSLGWRADFSQSFYSFVFKFISRLPAFSASWSYEKIQGTHHCVVAWVLRSLVNLLILSSFRVFWHLFYIQCSWFLAVLCRRTREKHIYFIFPEAEVWIIYALSEFLLVIKI